MSNVRETDKNTINYVSQGGFYWNKENLNYKGYGIKEINFPNKSQQQQISNSQQ